jgi:hypothetical protein
MRYRSGGRACRRGAPGLEIATTPAKVVRFLHAEAVTEAAARLPVTVFGLPRGP